MQFKTISSSRRAYQPLTIAKKDIESKIKAKAREIVKNNWSENDPFTVTHELRFIFAGKRMQSSVEVHFSRVKVKAPDKQYSIQIHIEYDNHKTYPIGVGYVTKKGEISFDPFNAMN